MKVLQINKYDYLKGGTETVFFKTIELLRKADHQVITFTTMSENGILHAKGDYSIQAVDLRKAPLWDKIRNLFDFFYNRAAAKELERIIKSERPDIAHLHLFFNSLSVSILSVLKKYKIPVVLTLHDYRLICPSYTLLDGKKNLCKRCKNKKYFQCIKYKCGKGRIESLLLGLEMCFRKICFPVYKYVDTYLCVSHAEQEIYNEFDPIYKEKALVVYNPIEKQDKREVKRGDYILFYGRLSEEKGIDTLLSVAAMMPHQSFIIAGTGKDYKEYTSNVRFVGFKKGKELKELIYNSSYVVVPSEWYETFGLVVAESFACAKPVIASRLGALPELIEDTKNGFLFEAKNKESLHRVINQANELPFSLYEEMCNKAYNSVLPFAENRYIKRLLEVYATTISNLNHTIK